ncbi:hypothetical protein [Nitrosopumilus sp. b2]|uniref:hypothetical protein n=1 Tax=Nitrosopumilus sp. b2 TaxID=2109908 RepID=UPI0015F6C951|nr:hypothetical protein [Nitrosopumilus sp. b2]KAF6244697.1 hypothetical protein C6989_07455 [Nitrosopumilus sp. b2]
MLDDPSSQSFRENMIAEIKRIQNELNEIKTMRTEISAKRKPAKKTVKRKPAKKTVKRKPAKKTVKSKRKTRRR